MKHIHDIAELYQRYRACAPSHG